MAEGVVLVLDSLPLDRYRNWIQILMCDRASCIAFIFHHPSYFLILAFLSLYACALKRPTI